MVKTEDKKNDKNEEAQTRVLRMGNDHLFKSLFRSVEARGMVARVLSKITGLDEEILLNADYIGGEIPKQKEKEKSKTSDVLIKFDDNSRIIVEMNRSHYNAQFRKNTSYAFANYIEHTPIGAGYKEYPNIILVNIDAKKVFKTKKPVSTFEIRNEEGELEVDSYKSFHFIIENAAKREYNKDEDLYQFALFMKAEDMDILKSVASGNESFEKAFRKVEEYMSDEDFLVYYDKEEMDNFEKEEFRKDGLKEGLEQGRTEGLEQGRDLERKTIIQNMMDKGMSISEISELINIKEEVINNLLN